MYMHTTQPWKKNYWQNMPVTLPIDAKHPNPGAIKLSIRYGIILENFFFFFPSLKALFNSIRFIPAESNIIDPINQRVLFDKYGFDIGDRSVSYELLQTSLINESKVLSFDWQEIKYYCLLILSIYYFRLPSTRFSMLIL